MVRPYGFVKLNASTDLTTFDTSDALHGSIHSTCSTRRRKGLGGDTQMSARRSRLGFETWTPVNADFWGVPYPGRNGLRRSKPTQPDDPGHEQFVYAAPTQGLCRFRCLEGRLGRRFCLGKPTPCTATRAYYRCSGWSELDFSWGSITYCQAQIPIHRTDFKNGNRKQYLRVAVESPYSDVTDNLRYEVIPTAMEGVALAGRNRRISRPESSIRTIGGTLWRSARCCVRKINLNDEEGAATADARNSTNRRQDTASGPTVVFNAIKDKLILMASGNVGTGLGRYLDATSNGFGAMSNFGLPGVTGANAGTHRDAVGVYGGMIGAQYYFTKTLRTNMSIGGARLMMPSYAAQFGGVVGSALPPPERAPTSTRRNGPDPLTLSGAPSRRST